MPKEDAYRQLIEQARRLLEGEPDLVANTANLAALLYHALPDVNWVGFYFHKDGQLVLGPFQGKTACVRIPLGKGVCGTAAQRRETVVVDNVHEFPGHISCDAASNSEIVVPLVHEQDLIGVLDIDSPQLSRFDDDDRAGLEAIAAVLRTAGAACDDLRNRLA
jgi:L-methionine (R)-S-oxide reductase